MLEIKNLLINLLFVTYPYLLTDIFYRQNRKKGDILFSFLSFFSILLCMNFPVINTDTLKYDLRFLPLLFAILYGGRKLSIFLLIFIIGYRFYFPGIGAWVTMIAYPILFLIIFPFRHYYKSLNLKKKILFTMSASFMQSLFIVFTFTALNSVSTIYFARMVIQVFITAFVTFLLEKYQENQVVHETVYQAEKLKAVTELAASVSHEIRNPMTVVRGFIQLIMKDPVEEKHHRYLKISMDELNRAEKIIDDYLTFARPKTDQSEEISLAEELDHVSSILLPYAMLKEVEIQVEKIAQGTIWGDRSKLRQALLNLAKNGIESMPNGGELKLRLDWSGAKIVLEIRDSGVGMTKDQMARLGTPFYSLKDKGTGLGTMVSYRIIDSLGGKIDIQSEPKKGSAFYISFQKEKLIK